MENQAVVEWRWRLKGQNSPPCSLSQSNTQNIGCLSSTTIFFSNKEDVIIKQSHAPWLQIYMALYTTPMEDIEGSSNRGDSDNFVCFKKNGGKTPHGLMLLSPNALCVWDAIISPKVLFLSISFYLTLTDNYVFFLLEEKQHDCCSATYARNNQAKKHDLWCGSSPTWFHTHKKH